MHHLTSESWQVKAFTAAVVLALIAALPAAAQMGTLTGQVVAAETERPLVGAQILVVGTGLGTVAGQNGQFTITNVPAGNHTIQVSMLGFGRVTQEVGLSAGATVRLNFVLRPEALGLDEMVITGTAGAARRREVGNSVSQINLADVLEPPVSTDALLQARVPGMTVMQSSAVAGGGAMIRLRGNVSVAMSNQPIIYIDGVRMRSDGYAKNVPPVGFAGRSANDIPSPLNNINPADIERIEVIKGAAATTLFGTEAAAGVIQIFTKRGQEAGAQWTAQMDQGFSWVRPFGPDPSDRPPSEPARTEAGGTSDFMFINPWLRTAWQQRYSLSVRGGGQALQYFVSGSLTDNEGVLPNDHEDKVVVRGNFTFAPIDQLQLQWNTSYTNTSLAHTPAGNNAHGLTLNAFRRDRNYAGQETREAIDPILNQEISSRIDHLVTGVTATYTPIQNLTNRLTVGYDLSDLNNRNFRPFGFALAPTGILSDDRVKYTNLTFDYVGTYDFRLSDDLRSSFSWGGQSVTTETESTTAYGEDFPGPGRPVVSSAGTTLGFEARQRVVNAGFFFQNIFDLRDRYFLTLGIRVDGNSAFGSDLGLEAYPKASFSYVISDEDFWNDSWGQVKLRTAWGESGRAPGAFDAVRTYDPVGWGGQPAFFPLNVGNPTLGPERTSEWEFGFDGSFLGDRLAVDFTWYHQNTRDALFSVSQIPSLGFLGSQLENVGEMENRGIELGLGYTVLQRRDYSWDVGMSISTNKSEVISLGGAPEFEIGTRSWIAEGQPAPVLRGLCVTNPEEAAAPVFESDCVYGPNQPTRIIQGSTTVRLPHGLVLSSRGEFQGGHYIYDGAAYNAVVRSVRWPGCYRAYVIEETQGADAVPAKWRPGCIDVAGTRQDFFIYPADFFMLRELTLQAQVPVRWLPGQVNQAYLTLSGRNLWSRQKEDFPVFTPETGGNVGFDTQVREIFEHVPPPATFQLSLRVVF
jgi:TonB-dependent starch-binding outer membrane protein SusC